MLKKNEKKGITSLVVVSLLLLVSVGSYFYVQDWFHLYKDDFEKTIYAKELDKNVEIVRVDGTEILVRNDLKDDLEIRNIKINGRDCEIASGAVIDKGLAVIDISSCTLGLHDVTTYETAIFTDVGIKEEYEIIKAIPDGPLFIKFQFGTCDLLGTGYVGIYSMDGIDNAHAGTYNQNPYNVCVRHLNYSMSFGSGGVVSQRLFSFLGNNNSALWVDRTSPSIPSTPLSWVDIDVSSDEGNFTYNVTSSDLEGQDYECAGAIDRDDVYGSHVGNCDSSLPHKMWLKLE